MITDEQLAEWSALSEEWRTHGIQRPGEHVIRCEGRIDADHRRLSKAMGEAFPVLLEEVERLRTGLSAVSKQAGEDATARNEFGCCGCVRKYEDFADNLLAGREWDAREVKP